MVARRWGPDKDFETPPRRSRQGEHLDRALNFSRAPAVAFDADARYAGAAAGRDGQATGGWPGDEEGDEDEDEEGEGWDYE